MNQWIWSLIVGAVLLILGLGILANLELKGVKLTVERSRLAPRVGTLLLVTVGLICIAIGLIGLLGLIKPKPFPGPSDTSPSPPAPPTPSPPTPTDTGPCTSSSSSSSQLPFRVTLSKPEEGARVPKSGVRVAGDVEGELGNCVLWLFTFKDGVWYVAGPIDTSYGKSFERHSGPLGVKGQEGETFSLRIVAVEKARSKEILNMKPNKDGDVRFESSQGHIMAKRQVKRI